MSYSEWCPRCGAKIVHVTRGIPSIGRCENNHMTDRRDVLRRDPKIDWRDARIEALEAELANAQAERDAAVAAAYEAAWRACERAAYDGQHHQDDMVELGCLRSRDRIRALALVPQRDALARVKREARREALPVAAALAAAISLLERGGKKAAPSDKMFEQMLADYRKALDDFRAMMEEGDE